jgi:hypothetical protein
MNVKSRNQTLGDVSVQFSENGQNYVVAPGEFSWVTNISALSNITNSYAYLPSGNGNAYIPGVALVLIVLVVMFIFLVITVGIYIVYRRKSATQTFDEQAALLDGSVNGGSAEIIIPETENLIDYQEITAMRKIDKGSFGVIYEAKWRGTKIAVKKLSTTKMTRAQQADFVKEAMIMQSLRHPNILQYLGIAVTGKNICICMEFMSKGSLYRILHAPKSDFDSTRIIPICKATARGLNYLHHQQPPIIHRDLKSHNLLVRFHFRFRLIF